MPLAALFALSCVNSTVQPHPADSTSKDSSPSTGGDIASLKRSAKEEATTSAWQYSEEEDKMTSKTSYFAAVDANELLDLKFPYNGGVTAEIMVRHRRGENNALLSISKGQFMPGTDGETIKVRFDSSKAEEFDCVGSSDDDSRYLFINSSSRFIAKLKKAKKVLVEAELFDNGLQVMEFNTEGFKWDH